MSGPLELRPRALAAPGGLADALLRGEGPVQFPGLDVAASRLGTPARLPIEAFGATSPSLRARLERVLSGEGLVVTTGQQPVLFLGPLYVMYKALTAIELAARLEARLEVPVVPVFWIASDDHDWQEIGQCTVLSTEGALDTLRLEVPDGFQGRSAGPAPLGGDVGDLVDAMSELLPSSEFTPHFIDLLRDAYTQGETVSGAFAGALATLLAGSEYAWLDAGHPALKTAAEPFFTRLIERADAVLDAETRGAGVLEAAGHEPPIATIADALPLFFDPGEGRQRVLRRDDGFATVDGGAVGSADEWRARLASMPGSFSPNVSSRPVLESWFLPVAATVLGPGEVAYWAQLPPLFDLLDVPFPAIQQRAAWLVVEPRTRKVLERYGLDPDDLADGGDAAIRQWTADSRPEAVERAIGDLRGAIGSSLGPVETAVTGDFPGLRGAVGKARKGLFDAVSELEKAIDQEARRAHDTDVSRIRRTAEQVYPGRGAQERVLSPFYFLSRYGDDFLDAVRAATAGWLGGFLAGASDDS